MKLNDSILLKIIEYIFMNNNASLSWLSPCFEWVHAVLHQLDTVWPALGQYECEHCRTVTGNCHWEWCCSVSAAVWQTCLCLAIFWSKWKCLISQCTWLSGKWSLMLCAKDKLIQIICNVFLLKMRLGIFGKKRVWNSGMYK